MDLGQLPSLLSGGSFSRRLEGFLYSDTAGKRTTYRDVPEGLHEREQLIRDNFQYAGIKTIAQYSGYYTALSYNNRARFVNGVASVISTVSSLLRKDTVA